MRAGQRRIFTVSAGGKTAKGLGEGEIGSRTAGDPHGPLDFEMVSAYTHYADA